MNAEGIPPEGKFILNGKEYSDIGVVYLATGHYESLYKDVNITGAWGAIRCCTENKLPLPDWVLSYLTETANGLLDIDAPDKNFSSQVVSALGIKASDLSSAHKDCRDNNMYAFILFHEAPTMEEKINDAAGEFGLSFSTVKNLYYKMDKMHKEVMAHYSYGGEDTS